MLQQEPLPALLPVFPEISHSMEYFPSLEGFCSFSGVFIWKLQLLNQRAMDWDSPIDPAFPFPKILCLGAKSKQIKRKTHPILSEASGSWNSLLGIPNPFPKIPAKSRLLSMPFLLSLSHHSKPNPSSPLCSWEQGEAFHSFGNVKRGQRSAKSLGSPPCSLYFYPCFPELLLGALGSSFTSESVAGFRHSPLPALRMFPLAQTFPSIQTFPAWIFPRRRPFLLTDPYKFLLSIPRNSNPSLLSLSWRRIPRFFLE